MFYDLYTMFCYCLPCFTMILDYIQAMIFAVVRTVGVGYIRILCMY